MVDEVDAVACALAGIAAVEPRRVTEAALRLFDAKQVTVVAIGKAAVGMARGAADALGDRINRGIVVAPSAAELDGFECYVGGHPLPNESGVRAGERVEALVSSLGRFDSLVKLLSGGASALVTLPARGLSLEDVQCVTDVLLRSGATIGELNCVRKHVDRLKGGRLTRLAASAGVSRVAAFAISDVIGDAPDVIGSGPTVPDSSCVRDAVEVLRRRRDAGIARGWRRCRCVARRATWAPRSRGTQ
jgi:glycerate 2-kinase